MNACAQTHVHRWTAIVEASLTSVNPWTTTATRTFAQASAAGVSVEQRRVSLRLTSHRSQRISAISAGYVIDVARVAVIVFIMLTEGTSRESGCSRSAHVKFVGMDGVHRDGGALASLRTQRHDVSHVVELIGVAQRYTTTRRDLGVAAIHL